MTMLDIHEAAIARNLCILMLLYALADTDDAATRTEILATLMYSFCGVAMPSYCDRRSVNSLGELNVVLTRTRPDYAASLEI